jgi:hypothetical protein
VSRLKEDSGMLKCPKCGEEQNVIIGSQVKIKFLDRSSLGGIAYSCSSCSVILNVELDPKGIKEAFIAQTIEDFKEMKKLEE